MNIAGKTGGSKWHSPMPAHEASMVNPANLHRDSMSAGSIHSAVDGEFNDLPGQHAVQNVSSEYGAGRHEAYDSPLAQPAYSGHGKVQVGKTSAL